VYETSIAGVVYASNSSSHMNNLHFTVFYRKKNIINIIGTTKHINNSIRENTWYPPSN